MPKDARDRELARAAEKREQEKRAAEKRRSRVKATVSVVAVLLIVGVTYATMASRGNGGNGVSSKDPLDVVPPRPSPQGPCDFEPPMVVSAKMVVDKAPKMSIDTNKDYVATMSTSCGDIKIKLLAKQAPVAVNNFVFLVGRHWYDGLLFHRIADSIDIIQGGDASCANNSPLCGKGTPGYTFADELTGKEKYTTGTVAMANSGPDTNGSQFFIVTGPEATGLPPKYTIFGKLIGQESLQVAQMIQSLPVKLREGSPPGSEPDQPVDRVWIRSVKIQGGK